MGSAQTLASKSSQENVTSNNARSIDDCSSQGVSLQRKAIAMQGNSNVMQRMAWVATKPLDFLSSTSSSRASGSGGDVHAPLDDKHYEDKKIVNGERQKLDYNVNNIQRHHRHFIFSPLYMPKGRNAGKGHGAEVRRRIRGLRNVSDGGPDNNIGYRSAEKDSWLWGAVGKGELFSEDVMHRGYTLKEKISYNDDDDDKLLNAIGRHTPAADSNFERYVLPSNNCQDWVETVRKDAGV